MILILDIRQELLELPTIQVLPDLAVGTPVQTSAQHFKAQKLDQIIVPVILMLAIYLQK